MRLGTLELGTPVYLAPMAGVTNEAFRRLCREQGADVVMSEMVSARALVMGNERTRAMLGVAEDEHPVAIQLFGSEPDVVAEAAVRAEAAGADIVDLNLGCPVDKIVRGGSGAALLRDPERAAAVVERTYTTPAGQHGYLEPQATVAWMEPGKPYVKSQVNGGRSVGRGS